jgi:hypothetical protein
MLKMTTRGFQGVFITITSKYQVALGGEKYEV